MLRLYLNLDDSKPSEVGRGLYEEDRFLRMMDDDEVVGRRRELCTPAVAGGWSWHAEYDAEIRRLGGCQG